MFSLSVSVNARRGAGPSRLAFLTVNSIYTHPSTRLVLLKASLVRVSFHMSVLLSKRCMFYRAVQFVLEDAIREKKKGGSPYVLAHDMSGPHDGRRLSSVPLIQLCWEGMGWTALVTLGLFIPGDFCMLWIEGVAKQQDNALGLLAV